VRDVEAQKAHVGVFFDTVIVLRHGLDPGRHDPGVITSGFGSAARFYA
jgi:hypothetical protein